MQLDVIQCGDSAELMKQILPDSSIDLTVTSPPYDGLRKYKGFDWDFQKIAQELFRVTKPGGVVVWVVNDGTEGGSETGTSFRQALYFKDVAGFRLHDTMIWRKTNPLPQVRQPRYASCFEYMFVLSKGKPKTFNPIMRKTKSGGLERWSREKNVNAETGRTLKHMVFKEYALEYNVWEMQVARNKTTHPAVFPAELANRHISTWSNPGDIVLDPFVGSGTTAIEALRLNRHYIGFDISEEYCEMSRTRIQEASQKV
jgi:site-specific DNA-methyltransferase (adenine-specific)